MLPDFRPASFIASADALNSNIETLKANNIQNLLHLPGILELIPDIGALIPLITKIIKGDASALKLFVDILTKEILRFRFGTRPISHDFSEAQKALAKRDVAQLLTSKSATVYGSFEWEFPSHQNPWNDGRLVLVVRSKLRLRSDTSTLMAGLLTTNSLGLLPTLSRIWENLPFSFVIDWFVAMNKRLKLADSQLLFGVFALLWGIYSYSLIWYPSEDFLSQWKLTSSNPDEPFGIVAYRREFSCRTPRLRDSRFDFLAPSHGPDPVTVGALIWQLFS